VQKLNVVIFSNVVFIGIIGKPKRRMGNLEFAFSGKPRKTFSFVGAADAFSRQRPTNLGRCTKHVP
jgi:hypothetical protein